MTIVVVVGIAVFSSRPWSWSGGFSGGMMGNSGMIGGTVQNPALPYFGVAFVVLIGVVVAGVVGLAYYVAVPAVRAGVAPAVCENVQQVNAVEEEKEQSCLYTFGIDYENAD